MKIEMGESLFYSWLRHAMDCQIVQTNWTTSKYWTLLHEDELNDIMSKTDQFFKDKYGYSIYKKTRSLSQLFQQAECDVLGIAIKSGVNKVYAVDVAFHEDGLNYNGKDKTIMKILAKCLRTAMCVYGYLDTKEAEIIFASPIIKGPMFNALKPCLKDMQDCMDNLGFNFTFHVIANEEFRSNILDPILGMSKDIKDTNELFIRSYHMLQIFDEKKKKNARVKKQKQMVSDAYEELKIGKIVQLVLRPILESGEVSAEEIEKMQDVDYSLETFGINYPLLVKQDAEYDRVRYYSNPVVIDGDNYMLCSQWFEVAANNDRPYLLKWLSEHSV